MLFYMVGVQQLLCFLTQRFFQEVLVKLLYIRIVVGLVQRTVAVDGIEKKGARFAKARETVAFLLAQKSLAKNALPYSLWFVISERLLQHINGCTGIF